MRYAHTVAQVRDAEDVLLARLPEGALMQRAAHGLAYAVLDLLGSAYGRRVLLLVGAGDNGGDALHAGAVLARRGARVEAWLLSDTAHEAGLAALRAAGGRVTRSPSAVPAPPPPPAPRSSSTASSGSGAAGDCDPRPREALARVAGIPVVAVDTPSGVEVDTGEIDGDHVTADLTVTFGTHQVAHLVDPAARACGAVHLVDLGLDLPPATVEALQAADVARLLPRPDEVAHKYTRGVVGVRAGSAAYPGAALLSVGGAASGLVGMVRFVGDDAVAATVREVHPEVVGAGRVQAWVVGSGSGDDAARHLAEAVADGVPVVVDADALAHLQRPAARPDGPDAARR